MRTLKTLSILTLFPPVKEERSKRSKSAEHEIVHYRWSACCRCLDSRQRHAWKKLTEHRLLTRIRKFWEKKPLIEYFRHPYSTDFGIRLLVLLWLLLILLQRRSKCRLRLILVGECVVPRNHYLFLWYGNTGSSVNQYVLSDVRHVFRIQKKKIMFYWTFCIRWCSSTTPDVKLVNRGRVRSILIHRTLSLFFIYVRCKLASGLNF